MEEVRQEVEALLQVHLDNLNKMNGEKSKKGEKKKKSAKSKGGRGKPKVRRVFSIFISCTRNDNKRYA